MTLSKPKQGSYDPNYDPRPKTVTIGISLITVEEHTFEQDGRAVTCPVDTDIAYISVPREVVYSPGGGTSYDIVADILDAEGYPRRLWRICGIWCVTPDHIANEIF